MDLTLQGTEQSAVNVVGTIPSSDSDFDNALESSQRNARHGVGTATNYLSVAEAPMKAGKLAFRKRKPTESSKSRKRGVKRVNFSSCRKQPVSSVPHRAAGLHSSMTMDGPEDSISNGKDDEQNSDEESMSEEEGEDSDGQVGRKFKRRRKSVRKNHYTDGEALEVAKCWVAQSHTNANQKWEMFWDGVCQKLESKTGSKRGAESVHCLWKRMNKECALYLSLREEVEKRGSTSGRSEQQVEQIVSDLFTRRTGRPNKDGIRIAGPPFRYKQVAEFLSSQPKWERQISTAGRPVRSSPATMKMSAEHQRGILDDYDGDGADDDGSDVNDATAAHGLRRPIGIKAKKAMHKDEVEKRKFRKVFEEMNKTMAESNSISRHGGMMDRRVSLLGLLPRESSEYKRILSLVMTDVTRTGDGDEELGRQYDDGDGDVIE